MKTYLISFVLLAWILFSAPALAHEYTSNNLSPEQEQAVEKRLWVFFNAVEKYSIERQTQIYTILDERLEKYVGRYAVDSVNYSIIDILTQAVEHKKMDIASPAKDILSHVIYGTNYHIVVEPEVETIEEIIITEKEIIVEEKEVIYRADLDTENLNEYDKNILAWTAGWIMSVRIRADREPIETETVEIGFNQDIDNIWLRANLYHDGILIAESSKSDADGISITFENLKWFIIGETTSFLQIEILPEIIWRDHIWEIREGLVVTGVSLRDNTWTISGRHVWTQRYTDFSPEFNIVPLALETKIESQFEKDKSIALLHISTDAWENNDNGNGFSPELTGINIEFTSIQKEWDITVFNGNGEIIWFSVTRRDPREVSILTGPRSVFIPLDDSISNKGEVYEIVTNAEGIFRIPQDGIRYSTGRQGFETNLEKELFLGER